MHNVKEMDSQKLPGPPVSLEDQSIQLSCLQAIPAASSFSLSPVILQPEQALSQTIYLKALTIPLYQPIQSERLQPNSQLPSGQASYNLKNSNMPLILSSLVHSEGTDQLHASPQKPPQTINIVSGLPVLPQNSSPCMPLGSPGRSPKSAGKYLCKHCGRDCLKPSVLEKHMRSHTGERPFPCTTCGIAFKTQSNLYKHRRTQTHVNNARPPSDSDSCSLLEEGEKEAENVRSLQTTKTSDRDGVYPRAVIKQAMSESTAVIASENHPPTTSLSAANALTLVSEGQCVTTDNSCHGGVNQNVLEKETMKDLANLLQRRKIQDQKSPMVSQHSQLQRQQATYPEKLWDSKSPDYKLKKCESTDSGYLSRSDSVEQQMMSPSPLHSLCEHSTESDGDATTSDLRCTTASHLKADPAEKATGSLALEKKKLEEHIAKLISQNKAVVDDTQLDNVRPRKTVLSKQGSIDLPMPYTYKDSFHFDIRSLDVNRRKNLSLCSAKSTFTPIEKVKPLFFHSVPTQFSTTIDCVPVTRSNSLPFVESTRRIQDHGESSPFSSFTRVSLNTNVSGLSHSKRFASSRGDLPSSHPRALVRQGAVDDLPLGNMTESSPSEEPKGAKKTGARVEGVNVKCKKSSQRKVKMFSQEKWQVYGDETFKKIYQKMKSKQKGNKVTDISGFQLDTKEAASHERITGPQTGRCPSPTNLVPSPVAVPAKLNTEESEGSSIGSRISQSTSSQEGLGSFSELMETSFSVNDGGPSGMPKTFAACRCRTLCAVKKDLNGNNQILSLNTGCESKLQLHQAPDQETNILSASLQKCSKGSEEMCGQGDYMKHVPEHEDIPPVKGEDPGGKESFPLAQVALPLHQGNCDEPVQEPQKLPSERKKLKVDERTMEESMLNIDRAPSSPKDRIVKLLDQFKIINVVAPVSITHSVKVKTPKFTADKGSSVECKEIVQYPMMSSNRDYSVNTASVSAFSFSEQLRSEVTKEYICSSYSFHKRTENPSPMIKGTRTSSLKGDIVTASPSIQPVVTPHLKENEFLPKYILKYPQEGNTDMSLLPPGKLAQKACISLPMTSTNTINLPHNYKSLGTSSADVCMCPLQLELSHPTRTKELKCDAHPTRKSLVACSPAILETTSIATRLEERRHEHQSAWQEEKVKEVLKRAEDRDNIGEAQEGEGGTMVCSSYTAGKKICFTSMYTGGFFISSDMIGRNPALKLIHSGNSSVISVSSLVERAALHGNHDNKIKEWEPDINPFTRLPTSSVDNSRCLCRSSDMLYCHVVCTPQEEVRTLSQLSMISHVANSKIPNLSISFPSLNAEPRLTWCCLTRNLPLPVEQKEKKDSAYSSLHTSENEKVDSKCSLTFCKMKHARQAASEGLTSGIANTSMAFCTQSQQTEKLYFSTAGGDELLKSISEQEKTNETHCKIRELTTISKAKRSRKRKKMKINPKRYKGNYGHRHLLLKTSRLSKQHWPVNRASETPKKHHYPYIPDGAEHCGKCLCLPTASQGRGPNLQQHTSSTLSEAASFVKKHPTQEGSSDSGMMFSSLGSLSNQQEDSEDGQVASRPGGILSLQRTVPASHSCTLPTHVLVPKDVGLNAGSLGKSLKDLQPEMHPEYLCTSTGTCHFAFRDPGESHPCGRSFLEVTRPVSNGPKADCKNVLCMESRSQKRSVFEPLPHVPGRTEQTKKGNLYSPLHEKLPSVIQTQCCSLKSKLLTEMSVSNVCLTSSRHAQTAESPLHHGSAAKSSSMQLDNWQGKLCASEFPVFRNPSAPLGSSGTPSKSYKKQTLEMMNKQTHVEEDTSSEDEDRLIIEI
ncbi:zinc finger protein 831 [Heteronotia binoei]|uniref:zinc finger protein 831 n=1 Tax=Heteronotia binoei TaxID=13085 RepID=UPI00292D207B|nr:zinc finger protein 831 [Heteronotia binoei]